MINPRTGEVETRPAKDSRWWDRNRDTVFYSLPPISGLSSDRRPFSTRSLSGKIYVASFFGPDCDSICLKVAGQLNRVQDIFGPMPDVVILSYTDSLNVASSIFRNFEVQAGKWLLVQPDTLKSSFVGEQYYRIKQRPVTGRKGETFTLYEGLVLIDKEGHIRGFYNGTDKTDVDRLILEIRVLRDVYAKP
ncbi:SCO family protein [Larkinella soli]|uniref:SCO family protein n=1 Tax=Larkinella soli TaxID=1770527 RepID=UPI000FFC3C55|nr:SCO family protein [Larkinella soli]